MEPNTIDPPCVAGLTWVLRDGQGEILDRADTPREYLLGPGLDLLPALEKALYRKAVGEEIQLWLEPEHAFGDYDEMLVLLEPRAAFPDVLEEGMIFETLPLGCSSPEKNADWYAVTDIYPEHVVLDGNHPLAGMALQVSMRIHTLRAAEEGELQACSAGSGFFKVLPSPQAPDADAMLH